MKPEAKTHKPKFIQGMVCPVCYEHFQYPSVMNSVTDDYGRKIRTFYGWCFKCKRGFEVIQFERDEKWFIYKYRRSIERAGSEKIQLCNKWLKVSELPEPAPIVTGPGGEYNRQYIPISSAVLRSAYIAAQSLAQAFEELLKQNGEEI